MSDMTLRISEQFRTSLGERLPEYIQLKNETELDKNSDRTLDRGYAVEAGSIGSGAGNIGGLTLNQSFTFTLTQKFNGTEQVEAIKAELFQVSIEQLKYFKNTRMAGLSGVHLVGELESMTPVFIKESVLAIRTTFSVMFQTRF